MLSKKPIVDAKMPCKNNNLLERLLVCERELEDQKNDLGIWADALEEFPEIEEAFEVNDGTGLGGKTILDVGTDAVKPLLIALKLKPSKIIGINEDLRSFASDIEQKSKLLTETKIRFYNCSLFDEETFHKTLKREKIDGKFGFILVSKTLHHLRTAKCVEEHKCQEDEKCCKYGFDGQYIFEKLLGLGNRVIVYETFFPLEEDDDKVRGRGGYFTTKEWKDIFKYLSGKHRIKFIRPQKFHLNKKTLGNIDSILRQVDCICFYVEE